MRSIVTKQFQMELVKFTNFGSLYNLLLSMTVMENIHLLI